MVWHVPHANRISEAKCNSFSLQLCSFNLKEHLFLDVDECSTGFHRCDVNAVCNNNQGSHTCTCKAGYTGDGETCTGKLQI